ALVYPQNRLQKWITKYLFCAVATEHGTGDFMPEIGPTPTPSCLYLRSCRVLPVLTPNELWLQASIAEHLSNPSRYAQGFHDLVPTVRTVLQLFAVLTAVFPLPRWQFRQPRVHF